MEVQRMDDRSGLMDMGRAFISKIVDDNDITTAVRSGVRPEWFEDADQQQIYKWMLDYYHRYGEVPTEVALKTEYPNFRMLNADEPYAYYVDKFREQRKRSILMDTLIDAGEEIDKHGDIKAAQDRLSVGLMHLGKEISILSDHNAVSRSGIKERIVRYKEQRHEIGELTGIPTGFTTFDAITGGFHPEQLILFGGAQKQGKSFMLMKSAIAAQEYGKKVLFLSFEMSAFEQLCRYDAMCCGINASHLLRGVLDDDGMDKLHKGMAQRKNMAPFIISIDTTSMTTVSAVLAKIEEHQPDVVYIDGVYLMDNEVGAEALSTQAYTSISRSLKRLTQRVGIPLVGTTQALSSKMGRSAEVTMHSFAWTSAWAQDADILFGVERIPGANMLTVRVAGGRNVAPCSVGISCNWDESYFEEGELESGD